MITHKFREVMAFCDEVTVLRHGKFMGEGAVRDLTREQMARMMMGDAELPEQAVRLDVNGYSAEKHPPGHPRTGAPTTRRASRRSRSYHCPLGRHEIVGIAGVSGNGQRELVQVLAGQRMASGGRVMVKGEAYRPVRHEMRRHRFHVLP